MKFFEVKTSDYNVLIPVEHITEISGSTTSLVLIYAGSNSTATDTKAVITLSGFGTLPSAADGEQAINNIIAECAQNPSSIPLLKINNDDELTVAYSFLG
jgi:hypothetical protein